MGVADVKSAGLEIVINEFLYHGYRVVSNLTLADLSRRAEAQFYRNGRNIEGARNPGVVYFLTTQEAIGFCHRIGAPKVGDPRGNY